jgi:hypothetical protein
MLVQNRDFTRDFTKDRLIAKVTITIIGNRNYDMPKWATGISSLVVTLLFLLGVYGLAASPYADWVREFYAKRERLQTLFGNDEKKEK